jgi:hypothetical protein
MDLNPLVVWSVVAVFVAIGAGLTVACLARPTLGRVLAAVFWVAMAATNVTFGLVQPEVYPGLADATYVPVYREAFHLVAGLNPTLFALAAAAFQLAVAWALLGRGALVRLGLLGSLAYLLGIAALSVVNLVGTVILVVPFLVLLRRELATPPSGKASARPVAA